MKKEHNLCDQIFDIWHFGNFLEPVSTIILPKLDTFFDNFWNGVKIFHFSSEIILGQLL